MKTILFSIVFFSSFSHAARILGANWNPQTNKIDVTLAYTGGCLAHDFSVQWDSCTKDATTSAIYRFGQILDSGASDVCESELQKTFAASEPNDGCVADFYVLKSTSSKIPKVVFKH